MTKYRLKIEHDQDTENPMNCSDWELHSFNRGHDNYKNPSLALYPRRVFHLSYHEHGQCIWSLFNEAPQCRWDTVACAGILIAPTVEETNTDVARAILKEYTDWCNGENYYYSLEAEVEVCEHCHSTEWKIVDSCGGYIGYDSVIQAIKEEFPTFTDGDTIEIAKGWEDAFDDLPINVTVA